MAIGLVYYDKDVLQCKVQKEYDRSEVPLARKLVYEMTDAAEYDVRSQALYQILNYRTFLLENSNIVTVRTNDLGKMHEI
jgi:hypothetical protein